ncbi:ABC transporter permease [Intrasporangium calvum]|uniref:Binding-protein-dependent transport systems inner membrane component n=1 Tax=Intrasporangium calvum (strain ATCC 23552 / DSM 43043 / JCM 3097 / NBRC 12989 / NCIMB 10167 / NRRL B-3866 / 7 KIP) TaxID=710696 RepID=E6S6V4_INTC7|nr:ABC transporter permease [Intrasporangium calvum]ADU46840.1 binding-protein-dependent transport systems inner membrane component [Intrasporangium calvum DSM 43043]AXG12114.1 ABC transporter permease [Intrasporangium calvum]
MIDDLVTWLQDPAHWSGPDGVPARLSEHVVYTAVTVLVAVVLAVPLGAWVGHTGRGRWLVTGANALRAVPSLGLLFAISMLVGPLIQSSLAFTLPSIIVLVILAIPPLLSGSYAGVESVDPAARDAARGMGMRGPQVLAQVELPIAMPLLLSGLRSATLQVIATATIAASISLGGLGRYLIDGLAARDLSQMVAGSVLVALLALFTDGALALVQRFLVSPGISGRRTRVGPTDVARIGSPRAGVSSTPRGTSPAVSPNGSD